MSSDADARMDLADAFNPADLLLRSFVGRRVSSIEKSEYQLRLVFGQGIELIISSAWRLCEHAGPLIGSADFRAAEDDPRLTGWLVDTEVSSAVVSELWETKLSFDRGYSLEIFPDS